MLLLKVLVFIKQDKQRRENTIDTFIDKKKRASLATETKRKRSIRIICAIFVRINFHSFLFYITPIMF